jgi:hypothetical protein
MMNVIRNVKAATQRLINTISENLLFFTDSTGEIVLDKMLAETFLEAKNFEKIRFVLKGGPIINDATFEDAVYVCLCDLSNVEILMLSNAEAGTGPERSSKTVKRWIKKHDLIISKGHGNYEGLSEHNGLFFMLIAKCPVLTSDLNVEVGDIVLKYKK